MNYPSYFYIEGEVTEMPNYDDYVYKVFSLKYEGKPFWVYDTNPDTTYNWHIGVINKGIAEGAWFSKYDSFITNNVPKEFKAFLFIAGYYVEGNQ